MKVSTKGRYGLRAMIELSRRFGEGPLLMKAITESQGIPIKYLHALLSSLRTAGLIRSVRGARGGYMLSKAPSEITVLEVMEALEGDLAAVDCVRESAICRRSEGCASREMWCDFTRAIEDFFKGITLKDLASRRKEKR